MQDIFGREIKEGDIVVVKGSGGGYGAAKPMAVGVFIKKSVRLPGGSRRTARDMYLIENPGKLEQDIKDTVMKEIETEKRASAAKAQAKKAQQANMVGRVYQMSKYNTVYLYVGEKRVRCYVNGKLESDEIGNLYLECGRTHIYRAIDPTKADFDSAKKCVEEALSSWGIHRYTVIKSFKSYVQEYQDVKVPSEFELNGVHNWKTGNWNGFKPNTEMVWEEHNDAIKVVITDI